MTLSTSVVSLNQKTAKRYFWLFLGTIVFSVVYETQSHHVISLWMVCLPLYPLILGVLPFSLLKKQIPDGWARQFWHCGVATAMAGSCLTGIFRIAGTYMPYTRHFMIVSVLFFIAALIILGIELQSSREI